MQFFIKLITHPRKFFETLKKQKGNYKTIFLYLSVVLLISFVVHIIFYLLFRPEISLVNFKLDILNIFSSEISKLPKIPRILLISLLGELYHLISLFIYILIYHVFIKLLKKDIIVLTTLQTIIYAGSIYILFSAIPYLNLIALLYTIYTLVIGLRILQKMNAKQIIISLPISYLLFIAIKSILDLIVTTI